MRFFMNVLLSIVGLTAAADFPASQCRIVPSQLQEASVRTEGKNPVVEGKPVQQRAAIVFRELPFEDWSQVQSITLNFRSNVPLKQVDLRLAVRNVRKYHTLKSLALEPKQVYSAGIWHQVSFDLSAIPRKDLNEIRFFINQSKEEPLNGRLVRLEFGEIATSGQKELITRKTPIIRERVFPRTLVFPRNHLKYHLEANFFRRQGEWIDWPLFLRDGQGNREAELGFGSYKAFEDNAEICRRYGFDGFAALIIDVSDSYINRALKCFEYTARMASADFKILPEIALFKYGSSDSYLNNAIQDKKQPASSEIFARLLQAATHSPSVLRHQGKMVISSYMADSVRPELWHKLLEEERQKHGEQFLFVAEIRDIFYKASKLYHQQKGLAPAAIREIKDFLRSYLAVCDGISFAGVNHLAAPPDFRRVDLEFFRNIVIPILTEVMAEPAHQGKLLGLGVSKGYINHFANSNILEEGTKALRETFEAAMSANPDFIVMVEWNEVNENTNIEPTVCDGLTNQHLFRYYSCRYLDKKFPPSPPATVPNLVLSYPARRMTGDLLHLELLNIPDFQLTGPYQVKLNLKNLDGQTVWSSLAHHFDAGQLKAVQLAVPSDEFASSDIVCPELTVVSNGIQQHFREGMGFIQLKPHANWNYKDIKVPLRDIPEILIQEDRIIPKGLVSDAVLRLKSLTPLRTAELMRNDIAVLSLGTPPVPTGEKQIELIFNGWSSAVAYRPLKISLEHGTITGCMPRNRGWGTVETVTTTKEITIADPRFSPGMFQGILFRLQAESEAVLIITAGAARFRIPLRDLLKQQQVFSLEHGVNLFLREFHGIPDIPPHLNRTELARTVTVPTAAAGDVWSWRLVDQNGKIYRTRPWRNGAQVPLVPVNIFSEQQKKMRSVKVPADRWSPIVYDFNPSSCNGVLRANGTGMARFDAILGGAVNYGQPFFIQKNSYPTGVSKNAPQWSQTASGSWTLRFDGIGNYLVFPQEVVPSDGFTYDFRLKPEVERRQCLLRHYGKSSGFILGIYLENGVLSFDLYSDLRERTTFSTPAMVRYRQWNQITISYDLKEISVKVDQQPVFRFPYQNRGYHANPMVFGGWGKGKDYFQGELGAFSIR